MLGDYVTCALVSIILVLGVGVGLCVTVLEVAFLILGVGVDVRGCCFGIVVFLFPGLGCHCVSLVFPSFRGGCP